METEKIDLAQIAALLRATPQTLRSELSPLDSDIVRWRPASGEWCINEIIGHLIDTDQRAFAGRIQTMINEDRPPLESWDTDAVATSRRDDKRDLIDLIDELEAMRQKNARLILELTPDQLSQVGVHPKAGELQVIDFVQEWPYHDRSHLRQILSIVQQAMWARMGRIRDFIDPPI